MIDFEKLRAPFPADHIEWRVGSTNKEKTKGLPLAYIDARTVMQRLDEVCGPAGWQCRYPHADKKTVCEIGINCTYPTDVESRWIWKANGAGDTDFEAEKGALSDAFKRAAVLWGIGQYLYDVKAPWVAIVERGKSYVIADNEMQRLYALLQPDKPKQPTLSERVANFKSSIAAAKTQLALTSITAKGQALLLELAEKSPEMHNEILNILNQKTDELKGKPNV